VLAELLVGNDPRSANSLLDRRCPHVGKITEPSLHHERPESPPLCSGYAGVTRGRTAVRNRNARRFATSNDWMKTGASFVTIPHRASAASNSSSSGLLIERK
jgi:hypothetical protein